MKRAKGGRVNVPAPPMKPAVRFDVDPKKTLPKVGDRIECRVTGRVVSVEDRTDRYDGGTRRATVEIEHTRDAVTMRRAGRRRTMDEIEAANEKV